MFIDVSFKAGNNLGWTQLCDCLSPNAHDCLANHPVVDAKVVCPQLGELKDVKEQQRRSQVLLEVEHEHVEAIFTSVADSSNSSSFYLPAVDSPPFTSVFPLIYDLLWWVADVLPTLSPFFVSRFRLLSWVLHTGCKCCSLGSQSQG